MFTASDYACLYDIVFQPDYPGYTPSVIESPNGDGKTDDLKRYAHVAHKYLHLMSDNGKPYMCKDGEVLQQYLSKAHKVAVELAVTIGVPRQYWPEEQYGALRVLEYGPNAITHEHTDFDLFTLMCYRNLPEYFKYTTLDYKGGEYPVTNDGTTRLMRHYTNNNLLKRAREINKQVHFGELLEEISPTYIASGHEVEASNGPNQYSIVYFASPPSEAVLPSGVTVGKWMDERKKRSRYEKK